VVNTTSGFDSQILIITITYDEFPEKINAE
jgi:hypothetical protein